ncbi:MAG: hypothetical protein AVDCRST_MAG12-3154, partial [uncultured Rubrobacteraceae bacterium]
GPAASRSVLRRARGYDSGPCRFCGLAAGRRRPRRRTPDLPQPPQEPGPRARHAREVQDRRVARVGTRDRDAQGWQRQDRAVRPAAPAHRRGSRSRRRARL